MLITPPANILDNNNGNVPAETCAARVPDMIVRYVSFPARTFAIRFAATHPPPLDVAGQHLSGRFLIFCFHGALTSHLTLTSFLNLPS
jgi:hypothetical protein